MIFWGDYWDGHVDQWSEQYWPAKPVAYEHKCESGMFGCEILGVMT